MNMDIDLDDELADDPKAAIIEMVTNDLSRIKAAMEEIRGQIEQTQRVVDHEQQRNADIAAELRTINDNLDTTPRQDIQAKYDEALDARFRLTTMRGQLEKFQANLEHLEHQQQILSMILSKIQGVSSLEADNANTETNGRGGLNIVRIVQAQEEERQRLARQMHDGPAQSLTNFILQAEICQRLFDRNPDRAAEELGNLKTAASVTFQKVRDFIFDLRPMMLDDLGVVPTVRRYVDSFSEKYDIETRLELVGEERRLETHHEVMLFRGIQRLMLLSRDYANPGTLVVRIDMSDDVIKAIIEDDGRGFDTETAFGGSDDDERLDPRIQAILTLKEEFELVGGGLTINSSEADGTTIRLDLPSEDFTF